MLRYGAPPNYGKNYGNKPACWRWKPPADFGAVLLIEKCRREALARGGKGLMSGPDLEEQAQWSLLQQWHRWRCAICGTPARDNSKLVTDHDHATTLIRGLLCRSCNTAEGCNRPGVFNNYRERPPAVICGVRLVYGR